MTHDEPELVIITRRKHADGQRNSNSKHLSRLVKLNAQMLKTYFGYPLGVAAKSLGLGETALKRY